MSQDIYIPKSVDVMGANPLSQGNHVDTAEGEEIELIAIKSNTSGHSQRSEPLEESFQNVERGAVTLDKEGNSLTRHSRAPSKYVPPYNRNQQQQTENLLNALAKPEIGEHGELEPCLPGGLPYQVSGGVLPGTYDEDYLRPVGRERIYAEIVDRKVERQVCSLFSL